MPEAKKAERVCEKGLIRHRARITCLAEAGAIYKLVQPYVIDGSGGFWNLFDFKN